MAASDADLVAAMAAGSAAAARDLFSRLGPIVYGLALRIERNAQDAEEVLIDTFHQAWMQADDYQTGRGTVLGWLLNIARSRAIDRLRARRRSAQVTERLQEEPPSFPLESRDPEQEAIRSEKRERVRRALAELPQDQRWALELAYFLGLSQSQIAERLGLPLGTIKTRLRLGLEKLRRELGGGEP